MSDKLSLDEEIPIILLWCAALFWHSFYITTTVQTTWMVGKDVVDAVSLLVLAFPFSMYITLSIKKGILDPHDKKSSQEEWRQNNHSGQ